MRSAPGRAPRSRFGAGWSRGDKSPGQEASPELRSLPPEASQSPAKNPSGSVMFPPCEACFTLGGTVRYSAGRGESATTATPPPQR
eukprot:215504-Prymnesium_polylepis.1